ncbi:YopX family protein [Shouchella clausii]
MREIEFRGYDGAEWVYGTAVNYDKYTNTWYLLEHGGPDDDWIPVGRVGQYTGLKDKHGTKIFEDDVVATEYSDRKFLVFYDIGRGGFSPFAMDDGCGCCSDELVSRPDYCEVIGNKFENPELLNN